MGAKSLARPATSLYDEDFVIWTAETARLLRDGQFGQVDVEHVAEEIEDMGKSYQRELESRLTVLILHLLKWRCQPGKRTGGWKSTMIGQRAELVRLFRQAPSLRRAVTGAVASVYSTAAKQAAAQTRLPKQVFPRECPFSTDEILDEDFLPQP